MSRQPASTGKSAVADVAAMAGPVVELVAGIKPIVIDETRGFWDGTANEELRTPFGRTLLVEASERWSLARLKEVLRGLDVGTVDIRKRGSAVDVDDLQRRLKLTGSRAATLVLTRAAGRPWMLVCFEPNESSESV